MIGQYDRLSVVLKNVWRRGKERLKSSCRRRLLGNLFREDGPADQFQNLCAGSCRLSWFSGEICDHEHQILLFRS